jgi:hypothetical protein
MDFLVRIEESGFCQWVREADSLFAFPGILLLHTIGIGIVVGINAMFDLRILGFGPSVRLQAFKNFFPVMWLGFWINAVTGAILLAVNATKMLHNPDFYVKLAFIAFAVINVLVLKREVLAQQSNDMLVDDLTPTMKARVLAMTSLFCWLGAITSGRLLAYVGRKVIF